MADGDGVTDIVDLSGNGSGVALNVFPWFYIPVIDDALLDETIIPKGSLVMSDIGERLFVGDGGTVSGIELAYVSDVDALADTIPDLITAAADIYTSKAAIAGLNTATHTAAILAMDGQSHLFLWKATDHSTLVAADPRQGVFIAPTSDPDGSSGAWVRQFDGGLDVRWFGAVGDGVFNNGAIFTDVLDLAGAIVVTGFGYSNGGLRVCVPEGHFYLGNTTLDLFTTIIFEGAMAGGPSGCSTVLRWDADTTGIRVQGGITTGAAGTRPYGSNGSGSIIRNFALLGGWVAGNADYHAIHLRAHAALYDMYIERWQGDGIYCNCSSGTGGATEGNANGIHAERIYFENCRTSVYLEGEDVNAGTFINMSTKVARQHGVYDSSFLGNTHIAHHTAACAAAPYKTDGTSAQNVFIGCYSESGQPASEMIHPTIVMGGLHAAGITGTACYMTSDGGYINSKYGFTSLEGNLQVFGVNHLFGPSTGVAANANYYFRNTANETRLLFDSYLGGVQSQDGYIICVRGFGMYYNGIDRHQFRVGGADIVQVNSSGVAVVGGVAASGAITGSNLSGTHSGTNTGDQAAPNVRYFTVSGTYTPTTGTKAIEFELVGGGGAGGGAALSTASNASIGGGGGGSGYLRKRLTANFNGATFVIGTGGTGVSGAAGNDGVDSTFTDTAATVYTAAKGTGGQTLANGNTAVFASIGTGGAATNGDLNIAGEAGEYGVRLSGTAALSGRGGQSVLGSQPQGRTSAGAGSTKQYGSGGSGAQSLNGSAAAAGGNGGDGILIIREYF